MFLAKVKIQDVESVSDQIRRLYIKGLVSYEKTLQQVHCVSGKIR